MWHELGSVVQIGTGYPFRGKVEHVPEGSLVVLQQKDVSELAADPGASLAGFVPQGAALVEEDSSHRNHLLQHGDVLLQVRGNQFLSVLFAGDYPAIAAQGVAVFRPKAGLTSEYLCWFLNHPKTTETLRSMAGGTHIPFLSKQTLVALRIPVPVAEQQRRIVEMDRVRQHHKAATRQLLQLTDTLVDASTWHAATQN